MYDTRLRLANQVVDEVRTHFQDLVLPNGDSQKHTFGGSTKPWRKHHPSRRLVQRLRQLFEFGP